MIEICSNKMMRGERKVTKSVFIYSSINGGYFNTVLIRAATNDHFDYCLIYGLFFSVS